MRQYYLEDEDGKKLIIEKDNGYRVEILEEPSAGYIANMPPPLPEPEGLDLEQVKVKLAEIDDLKARLANLEAKSL